MGSKRLIFGAASLTLFLGLVVNLPAAQLQGWLSSEGDPVVLYRVSGTFREGSASALDWGPMRLNNPEWRLNPWALLRGCISHDITANGDLGPLELTIERGLTGRLTISNARGNLPLDALIKAARIPAPPMQGALQMDIQELQMAGNQLRHIEGSLVARGLTWSLLRPPLLLGNYEILLSSDDDGMRADIADKSAELEVKGQATLADDGAYQLDLRLRPAETADNRIDNLLRPLGAPEGGGWYRIRQNGSIAPPSSPTAPPPS